MQSALSRVLGPEAGPVSDDTPTFAQPSITIRAARGFVPASLEVWMDARDILDTLQTLMIEGKNDLEARVLVAGVAASNEPVDSHEIDWNCCGNYRWGRVAGR
jgi:hypothetical protein